MAFQAHYDCTKKSWYVWTFDENHNMKRLLQLPPVVKYGPFETKGEAIEWAETR